jgi:hypothetical protein
LVGELSGFQGRITERRGPMLRTLGRTTGDWGWRVTAMLLGAVAKGIKGKEGNVSEPLLWFGSILIVAGILYVLIGVVHVQDIIGNGASNWLSQFFGNPVTSIGTA